MRRYSFLFGHTFAELGIGLTKAIALGVFAVLFHLAYFQFGPEPKVRIFVDPSLVSAGASVASRIEYVESHPDLAPEVRRAISVDGVTLGMSEEEVRLVCGAPSTVDSEFASGTERCWIYFIDGGADGYYLFFGDHGLVKSICLPDKHLEPLEIALSDMI